MKNMNRPDDKLIQSSKIFPKLKAKQLEIDQFLKERKPDSSKGIDPDFPLDSFSIFEFGTMDYIHYTHLIEEINLYKKQLDEELKALSEIRNLDGIRLLFKQKLEQWYYSIQQDLPETTEERKTYVASMFEVCSSDLVSVLTNNSDSIMKLLLESMKLQESKESETSYFSSSSLISTEAQEMASYDKRNHEALHKLINEYCARGSGYHMEKVDYPTFCVSNKHRHVKEFDVHDSKAVSVQSFNLPHGDISKFLDAMKDSYTIFLYDFNETIIRCVIIDRLTNDFVNAINI